MKTLKLDLDGKNGLTNFLNRIWIIKYLGLRVEKCQVHHTTNGFHVRLVCENEVDDVKGVLMQALLGSDYRRELCNLFKVERGSKKFNLLFKEKWGFDKLGRQYSLSKEKYDGELSEKVLKLIHQGE
jgi:hypothetical protein